MGIGYFLHFRQGTLNSSQFTVSSPSANQKVAIETENINNNDVWLYSVDESGQPTTLWTKVSATEGNNAIYNSIGKGIRNFYVAQKMHLAARINWPMDALQIPVQHQGILLATPQLIQAAHACKMSVHFWTINSADEMRHLLAIGADGIMSDDPELLVQVYRQWQQETSRNGGLG